MFQVMKTYMLSRRIELIYYRFVNFKDNFELFSLVVCDLLLYSNAGPHVC